MALFLQLNAMMDKILQTEAMLVQFVKREVYQGYICWCQFIKLNPEMLDVHVAALCRLEID